MINQHWGFATSWQKWFIFKLWDNRFLAMTSVNAHHLNGGKGSTVKAFFFFATQSFASPCFLESYFQSVLPVNLVLAWCDNTTVRSSQWPVTWGHQPWQEQALGGKADETETWQNSSGNDSGRLDGSCEITIQLLDFGFVRKMRMILTFSESSRTSLKMCKISNLLWQEHNLCTSF